MVELPCAKRQKSTVIFTEILIIKAICDNTLKLSSEVISEEITNVHHR